MKRLHAHDFNVYITRPRFANANQWQCNGMTVVQVLGPFKAFCLLHTLGFNHCSACIELFLINWQQSACQSMFHCSFCPLGTLV